MAIRYHNEAVLYRPYANLIETIKSVVNVKRKGRNWLYLSELYLRQGIMVFFLKT